MESISINSDIAQNIVAEIYKALEKLGADPRPWGVVRRSAA
jgi:hypothetical protein